MSDFVSIGRVVGIFGVQGWLKFQSWTEPPDNFTNYTEYWLQDRSGNRRRLSQLTHRAHGRGFLVRLENCVDRDEARDFIGCEICILSQQLPQLQEGEYYWHQLEGLRVFACRGDGSRTLLGQVDYLFATGANDVIVTRPCDDCTDRQIRLIPWNFGEVIRGVDLEAGELLVDPEKLL